MSIDIRELERLEAAAQEKCQCGLGICPACWARHDRDDILHTNVPDILSALRDKERLDRLERSGRLGVYPHRMATRMMEYTGDWCVGYVSGANVTRESSLRAAIDALPEDGK